MEVVTSAKVATAGSADSTIFVGVVSLCKNGSNFPMRGAKKGATPSCVLSSTKLIVAAAACA